MGRSKRCSPRVGPQGTTGSIPVRRTQGGKNKETARKKRLGGSLCANYAEKALNKSLTMGTQEGGNSNWKGK